ncbi:hypothetical protein C8R43DRAFT_995935 [Mycena crocata]|nr:hypothetical protein C8R43DRAFT_995935 [Mycena crocata]
MIRTYALYGRSKRLLSFFLILWFSIGGLNTWAMIQWTASFKIEVAPSPINSCVLDSSSNIGLICYVSLLAGETVIVALTLWKALQTFWRSAHGHTSLVTSFYRDGILFYLMMLLIFTVEVIVQSVAPESLKFVADTPLRVLHSIFACHLVIHIRFVASEEDTDTMKSAILFADST